MDENLELLELQGFEAVDDEVDPIVVCVKDDTVDDCEVVCLCTVLGAWGEASLSKEEIEGRVAPEGDSSIQISIPLAFPDTPGANI